MIIPGAFNPSGLPSLPTSTAEQLGRAVQQQEITRPVVPTTPSDASTQQTQSQKQTEDRRAEHKKRETTPDEPRTAGGEALSEEEKKQLEELQRRDREVRQHEAAHKAAAGQYAQGGINLSYERGPDGRNYAVGGDVNVDTGKVPSDPEATLRKAETIKRAALAPQEPSSQDRQVAAKAGQMAAEARAELTSERVANESASADDDAGTVNPIKASAARTFGLNQITTNGLIPTVGTQLNVSA